MGLELVVIEHGDALSEQEVMRLYLLLMKIMSVRHARLLSPVGGVRPKCAKVIGLAIRPRGVRCK